MNIKLKYFFSIAIIMGLFFCFYFFYSAENKREMQDISLNRALAAEKNLNDLPESIKSSSVQAKKEESNSKNNFRQPTSVEFNSRFDAPENIDLLTYVERLLIDRENDKTGNADAKLATVLYNCEGTSKNEAEWAQEKKQIESQALARGLDTGNSKTLEAVAFSYKFYQDCLSIKQKVSNKTPQDFYKFAADKKNGYAMVKLTKILPAGYDAFTKEEKTNFAKKMNSILNDAIDLCEPTAFETGAFLLDSTDKDNRFATSSDIPAKIRQYGLFLAYETYFANNTSDGKDHGESYELKIRSQTLASYEIEAGRTYGNLLYQKACNKN